MTGLKKVDVQAGASSCGNNHVEAIPPEFVKMNPNAILVDLR